jgi:hypothetical protein
VLRKHCQRQHSVHLPDINRHAHCRAMPLLAIAAAAATATPRGANRRSNWVTTRRQHGNDA